MALEFRFKFAFFTLVVLALTSIALGQAPQPPVLTSDSQSSESQSSISQGLPAVLQQPNQNLWGNIRGTVLDQSGAVVAGAQIKLTSGNQSRQLPSSADGQFSFANVPAGSFQLTITSQGFAAQSFAGTLHPGEIQTVPNLILTIAANITEMQVGLPQTEVAEEQIKAEEKQRLLGAIPNFYVSYSPDPAPLDSGQKMQLAWRSVIDPFTLVVVAGSAGVEQAQDHFEAFGQGTEGYAKRFGAGYADMVSGTFIGEAILPSLLKQDPRYFYKGTGSKSSRVLYALANAVICKGDNRQWQLNYSGILGSLAAGGISNLYYPAQDRNGLGLTFENSAIGIGETAVSNLLQEFIMRKLTPKLPSHDQAKP